MHPASLYSSSSYVLPYSQNQIKPQNFDTKNLHQHSLLERTYNEGEICSHPAFTQIPNQAYPNTLEYYYHMPTDMEKNHLNPLNRFPGGLIGPTRNISFGNHNPNLIDESIYTNRPAILHSEELEGINHSIDENKRINEQSSRLGFKASYQPNYINQIIHYPPQDSSFLTAQTLTMNSVNIFQQANPLPHPPQQEDKLRKVRARLIDGKVWTEEDDKYLIKISTQFKSDWKKVARKFKRRGKKCTPNFLKIRYKELIEAPVTRKTKFTHFEDLLLVKFYQMYGSDWERISENFKKRSATMIKNRYYAYIRKNNIYSELLEEQKKLEREGTFYELQQSEEAEKSETFEVLVDEDNRIIDQPSFTEKKSPRRESSLKKIEEDQKDKSFQTQDLSLEKSDHTGYKDGKDFENLKMKFNALEKLFKEAQLQLQELKKNFDSR